MTNKIRAVATMLKRWRHKAAGTTASHTPAGHVAVYVGSRRRRYVVQATCLNHPIFKRVLADAEEEFGFPAEGPLAIPCDESLFEEILAFVSQSTCYYNHDQQPFIGIYEPQRCSHVGMKGGLGESRPLLTGVAD